MTPSSSPQSGPVRVMMVCTGNICRSPMAEIVLREHLERAGVQGVVVDSTGTTSYQQGNPIDRRARASLAARGYDVHAHVARQVLPGELPERELVLAMTSSHADTLRGLDSSGTSGAAGTGSDDGPERIRMFRTFDPAMDVGDPSGRESDLDLADPWYGDEDDFEVCLDQIEAAVPRLVEHLREREG